MGAVVFFGLGAVVVISPAALLVGVVLPRFVAGLLALAACLGDVLELEPRRLAYCVPFERLLHHQVEHLLERGVSRSVRDDQPVDLLVQRVVGLE